MTKKLLFFAFSVLFAVSIFGCNSKKSTSTPVLLKSSASAPKTAIGFFVDAPVEGLRYTSGTISGFTGQQGYFSYIVGDPVTFSVGGINLGTIPAGKPLVTPVDLVPGNNVTGTTPEVVNIADFIQSLDNDANLSNGITITPQEDSLAKGASINFNQTEAAFAADGNVQTIVANLTAATTSAARSLIASATAQINLKSGIDGFFAGKYTGSYTGKVDSGTWSITVTTAGAVTGTGTSSVSGKTFALSGAMGTNDTVAFASTTTGDSFSGVVDGNFGVVGSWSNAGTSDSGTIIGGKI